MKVDHALQCKNCGLVTICHRDVADQWGALCTATLTPSAVTHKTLINYGGRQTVTGGEKAETEEKETQNQEEEKRKENQVEDKDLTEDEKEEQGDKGIHRF